MGGQGTRQCLASIGARRPTFIGLRTGRIADCGAAPALSIRDTYKPDGTGTRSAKVIVIRDDALEAFNEAHRKATGSPIDLTRPEASSKIPLSET
jgi:hypothetical protein